jgi:hypothetical protein
VFADKEALKESLEKLAISHKLHAASKVGDVKVGIIALGLKLVACSQFLKLES